LDKINKAAFYIFLFGALTLLGALFLPIKKTSYEKSEILGASSGTEVFVEPDDGREPIIRKIRSANKQLLIEVYLLSDSEIIDELIKTDQSGVGVKVILDANPFGGSGLNPKTKTKLESGGVEAKWSLKKFRFTHQKSIVFDQSESCILNMNLTTSAFTSNREFIVCTINKNDVLAIENIFWSDWNNTDFNNGNNNLIISPINSRSKITSLISQAKESVEVMMEAMEDEEIINTLIEKATKIPVRIILPPEKRILANKSGAERITKAGGIVKKINSPYIHAKLLVVDKNRAYIGSVNFTENSMDNNRELGIIISQSDSISRLIQFFEKDWEKGEYY
jgi:phosphatidylserine/phosphatidylglycerophosphate/cardiolipin synthase-like enzyme